MTYRTIYRALAILLAAACTTPNPNYRRPMADAMPELSCPDETTCEAPTGVCKLDTGRCVQCTAENKAACTGTTPICGEDFACRGCIAHSDCASTSNTCLPDGSCAAESEVAYVGLGGSGETCSKAQPCTLKNALEKTQRSYIKVTGTLTENVKVQNKRHVTVLADPGAKLTPKSDGILLELEGESNLTMYDLELSGAQGGAEGTAISMPLNNGSTLTLHRVHIVKNTGAGIIALGGTLNIYRSTIAENAGGGINMVGATTFDIRNNFIVRNGNNGLLTGTVGGIKAIPNANSKLEFNTIVQNVTNGLSNTAGGVLCGVPVVVGSYNLIFGNTAPPTAGECTYGNSFAPTTNAPDPQFASPTDFHLSASTPAAIRDVAACTAADGFVDIDGEKRPKNGLCDFGADEY